MDSKLPDEEPPHSSTCPDCAEKDKIIRALRLEVAQLSAQLNQESKNHPKSDLGQSKEQSRHADKSGTGTVKGTLGPGFLVKRIERRKSISNAQWANEEDDVSTWPPSFLSLWLDGKKLEQLKPVFFPDGDHPRGPMTNMFDLNPNVPNTVYLVSGAPQVLFEHLLLEPEDPLSKIWPHPNYVRDFTLIFQYFMTSEELLEKIDRIMAQKSGAKAVRCGQVLTQMSQILGREFSGLVDVVPPVVTIVDPQVKIDIQRKDTPQSTPEEKRRDKGLSATADHPSKSPRSDKKSKSDSDKVSPRPHHVLSSKIKDSKGAPTEAVNPRSIAEELTLLSEELLNKVTTTEFHNRAWESGAAKNLSAFMAHSNSIGFWASTAIIQPLDPQQRATVLTSFIHLAQHLLELRNFHDLMVIVAALESSQVRKLKKTWPLIHQKDQQQLDYIIDLMSPTDNYKKYIDYIADLDPNQVPVIPFINMILHDIWMIEEKMETMVPERPDEVNWVKMSKVATQIWKIRQFRQAPFPLRSNAQVRSWIQSQPVWPDPDIQYEVAAFRENSKHLPNFDDLVRGRSPTLNPKEISILTAETTPILSKQGTVIIDVGDTCTKPFLLTKGTIQLESAGQEPLLIKEGSFFCSKFWEEQFISQMKWVSASDDVEYHQVEKVALVQACKNNPKLYVKVCMMVAIQYASSAKKNKLARGTSTMLMSKSQQTGPLLKEFKCSKRATVGTVSGSLMVYETHYAFVSASKSFGRKTTEKIEIPSIKNVTLKKKEVKFKYQDDDVDFKFESKDVAYQAYEYFSNHFKGRPSSNALAAEALAELQALDEVLWEPNKTYWGIILKGARDISFKNGEFIITQGEKRSSGIYQLISGTCNITQRQGKEEEKVVETLKAGSTFGEISYILARESSGSSASIVATSDVEVKLIEGYYLTEMFPYFPQIQGSFYSFLAKLVTGRMEGNL